MSSPSGLHFVVFPRSQNALFRSNGDAGREYTDEVVALHPHVVLVLADLVGVDPIRCLPLVESSGTFNMLVSALKNKEYAISQFHSVISNSS